MNRFRKAFLRNILLIIAIVGFVIVLLGSRTELSETWQLLRNIDLRLVVLLPIIQLISYFFISNYYRTFLTTFGEKISAWRVYGTTIALNFVNQILPSGGASGITYLLYAFKDIAPPGQITLIQLGRYTFAFMAYIPLLIIGFIWLVTTNQLSNRLEYAYGFIFSLISIGILLLIMAIKNRSFLDKLVEIVLKTINKVVGIFIKNKGDFIEISRTHGFIKEFHDGVRFLSSRGRHIFWPMVFMQLSIIAEVMVVYTGFWAIGVVIDPAIVLIAFVWANVAGAVSIIPGDVGVHELAVITILSYVGISKESAIAGALLYRVFNKLIIMSIGFIFYLIFLKPLVKNVEHKPSL